MHKAEELLNAKKIAIDQVQVPLELESRLSLALEKSIKRTKVKRKLRIKTLVACLVLFFILGYHFDTLAFYGKKLIGYEQVMNGTLQQLNELGKGQIIDKKFTFKNGVTVTLDGIMLDDTQLLAFLTVEDPRGKADEVNLGPAVRLKGFYKEYYPQNGEGNVNQDNTKITWRYSFQPPLFLEKKLELNLTLSQDNISEEGEIAFTLERDKAMGHTLRRNLNESFTAHQEEIKLTSLLASPTQTIVKGSMQSIFALAKDYFSGERMRPVNFNMKLIANGQELAPLGGGQSTDLKGITFHNNYDALPLELNSLQIIIESFTADHDINKRFALQKGVGSKSIQVEGQDIVINEVEEKGGNTYVTITTEEGTVLTKVKLIADAEVISLEETIDDAYEKTAEAKIYHRRTLVFPGTGKSLELEIRRMTYLEEYQHVIDVPVK